MGLVDSKKWDVILVGKLDLQWIQISAFVHNRRRRHHTAAETSWVVAGTTTIAKLGTV